VTIAPDLVLNLEMRLVDVSGRQVRLTAIETRLLLELARRRGVIVHRNDLEQAIWGRPVPPSSRRLQMAVSRLRSKIGYHRIATVRDWGYTLTTWKG
jgi:two-component system OmpR family response regulator